MSTSIKKYRIEIVLFLSLFLTYSYFFPHAPGWNVNSRLCLTYALVDEGRCEIDSYVGVPELETGDLAVYNGHVYSDKIIGTSLAGAVVYGILKTAMTLFGFSLSWGAKRYLITVFSVCLMSALAGVVMYRVLLLFNATRGQGELLTLAFGLGTLIFPYSTLFFSYGPGVLCSLLAYRLLLKHRLDGSFDRTPMFLIGLFVGLMLLFEYTFGIVAIGLAVYAFAFLKKKLRILEFCGGAVIPLFVFALYLLINFDGLRLPYAFEQDDLFRDEMSKGFMGITRFRLAALYYITIHPYRGVFIFSPILFMFFVGLGKMAKEKNYRVDLWLAGSIVAAQIVFNASYYMWWGGWSSGARHLIPMLAFMFPVILFGIRGSQLSTCMSFVLIAISILLMLSIAATDPQPPQLYETDILRAPRIQANYTSPMFIHFKYFCWGWLGMNLGMAYGLEGLSSLLILLNIWISAGCLFVLWLHTRCKGLLRNTD